MAHDDEMCFYTYTTDYQEQRHKHRQQASNNRDRLLPFNRAMHIRGLVLKRFMSKFNVG